MKKTLCGLLLTGLATLALAACGSSSNKAETSSEPDKGKEPPALTKDIEEVCNGAPLTETPDLPPSFPQIEAEKLTYTKQTKEGPTVVVEGYFKGSVADAHEEFEKELKAAGYTLLFNELEAPHDSEISWKGEGRTGQVAMRAQCGDADKTYVHITNRPA